ncbi:hypothetical protein [Streptomyces sp. NPDC057580]|uniref:hypothetical protein n=1 Tax=Streptomyces sp. NPDC057580 TaxID=3346173 RepID=UPI0036B18E56
MFSEKISTRIKVRPEFVKAMDFARTIKKAVPHQRVILTVHEMKRLGRGAAELLAIAEDLRHHVIELELPTGPLQGVYNPSGHGAVLFAGQLSGARGAVAAVVVVHDRAGGPPARAPQALHGPRPSEFWLCSLLPAAAFVRQFGRRWVI